MYCGSDNFGLHNYSLIATKVIHYTFSSEKIVYCTILSSLDKVAYVAQYTVRYTIEKRAWLANLNVP